VVNRAGILDAQRARHGPIQSLPEMSVERKERPFSATKENRASGDRHFGLFAPSKPSSTALRRQPRANSQSAPPQKPNASEDGSGMALALTAKIKLLGLL
jgi:hypothetical protein